MNELGAGHGGPPSSIRGTLSEVGAARPAGARRKIVLYNPKTEFFTMPLALLAIGSALDPDVYEVVIIDGRLDVDPVVSLGPHLDDALCLGVTVLTGAPISDALRVSRAAKQLRPRLPIVWGGWHPSMFPRECLGEPSVDVTVQGQGEETFSPRSSTASQPAARWKAVPDAPRDSRMAGCSKIPRAHSCRSTDSVRMTTG